jgi:3'-phosphoadenosine 5'-phosphosulfate sulfotransferase (PAPS reductase)/FAD synthetase
VRIAEWQLRQRQAMPLDIKVQMTTRRIREWCERYDDQVYVAFSGGLDSTVLLHLVRQVLPDCPAVFHDTGLEFPEIREFVKTVENVTWTKPDKTFPQVLRENGYPVVSKRVAQYVGEVQRAKGWTATKRLRLTGIKSNGEYSELGRISDKWQYLKDAPFPISDRCCFYFKKKPSLDYEKSTGQVGFVGTRTDEGTQREIAYMEVGCNGYDLARPRSTPLAFWLHEDIKQYIAENNLPYSKIYDMGYERTGCVFCMFGAHLEKGQNRFQKLEQTHPQLHRYCMDKLGLREVLEYIGVNPYNTQLELFPTTGEE